MNTSRYQPLCQQRGAVLIISLMLLIILTMLGISALDSTKLETKMAANTAELNRALQVAEIGLKIPIAYSVDKIVDIATRGDDNPLPAEYYRFDSSNKLIPATGVGASSASYILEVQTIRSNEFYPDKSGKGKCSGDCVLNFIIKSTGRSREDVNAPRITLKGGMSRLIPTNTKTLTTTE
jgi:hypothetical protein